MTILPQSFQEALRAQLMRVKEQHVTDLTEGFGRIYLWPAWKENIPMLAANGPGNMSFRPIVCQSILDNGRCVGIISMRTPSKRPLSKWHSRQD